jgi:acetolactate decarboxylase
MKKIFGLFLAFALLLSLLSGCGPVSPAPTPAQRDTLTQFSTLDTLSAGLFDGAISAADVLKYGDIGLGTFDGLDGEMLVVDGKMYQVTYDGVAREAKPTQMIPYMAITYFDDDQEQPLSAGTNMKAFIAQVEAKLPTKNIFYAVRIDGTFQKVQTRAAPKQSKPYPPLADALKQQVVFNLTNVEGTMVGFWCPAYVKGINSPGFHLHFLTKDGKAGGHVLDFTAQAATVKLDLTGDFNLILPSSPTFYQLSFATATPTP